MSERDDGKSTDDGGVRVESEADFQEEEAETESDDEDHLADVEDGAGCTEIWERLSERREE